MKKLLILILCCLVGGVKAQSFCEVDSVYIKYDRETAYRIIEIEGNSFITVSIGGLNGSTQVNVPLVTLTKLNSCGHELWRKIIDFGYNNYAEIGEIWTDNSNGDVRFTALINGTGSLLKNNGLRMYKVNSQGEVIQNIKIGDTLFQYFRIKSLKINENKYILASNVLLPQNQNSVCYLIDSSGFILANIITPNQSSILEVDQKDDGTILLIFNQQANFLILNIDSLGGKISEWQIPKLDNSWGLQSFGTNFSGAEFLYSATRENKMALARLTLLGAKIKDTVFENESFGPFHLPFERNNINYLSDRYFIISKSKVVLMDTDFNVIKIDSSSKNNSRIYHSILSSDSSLVSVGNGNFRNVGSGNSVCDFWFGKTSISSFVKFVQITGINFINQNSGSIQLFAEILPATATNKIINWSIDDTSKALITQTGLLTAKANGVVTVVAKTTDGSNLEASKQITITNQGVGFINVDELMKRINVYPNPAESSVSVKSDFVKINWVQLLDIHSKTLATVNNSENIDISGFANGYYFLKIETEKGTVFKKLMINK